ncbi:MAG: response regulator [Desulfotignum sp.]|nr:response regulator [Desulfotignum sp.]
MEDKETIPKILVIDDEMDIRDGCERILSRMGYDVFCAENGQDGLQILENEDICIVLCDIKMPGMDGFEVLAEIKEHYQSVLVIMLTGFSTVETAIEAMKKGAYDFISKPFTPDELRIVIKRASETLHLTLEANALKLEQQKNLIDLETEQSRIRTILESLPHGLMVTNIQGQIVLMNPVAQKYLDLGQDTCVGKKIAMCIEDKGLCDYIMKISRGHYKADEDIPSYELALSKERFILAEGRPVLNEDAKCMGAVVTLSDITDLKIFDRLKSEFVAQVSHELRSPLSVIHDQLGMVIKASDSEKSGKSENNQYLLGRAREKTKNLISLIGDLLDVSRIEAGNECLEPVKVRVEDIIKKIVEFQEVQAKKKNQSIELTLPDKKTPPLICDPTALESIFGNLITNAIKYTPDGGKISIKMDSKDENIRVKIKDNGFGIEQKHLPRLFEKFYRVKDDNTRFINGTGLGLTIVKSLVDALKGSIHVESEPGHGTLFTVILPCNAQTGQTE